MELEDLDGHDDEVVEVDGVEDAQGAAVLVVEAAVGVVGLGPGPLLGPDLREEGARPCRRRRPPCVKPSSRAQSLMSWLRSASS